MTVNTSAMCRKACNEYQESTSSSCNLESVMWFVSGSHLVSLRSIRILSKQTSVPEHALWQDRRWMFIHTDSNRMLCSSLSEVALSCWVIQSWCLWGSRCPRNCWFTRSLRARRNGWVLLCTVECVLLSTLNGSYDASVHSNHTNTMHLQQPPLGRKRSHLVRAR